MKNETVVRLAIDFSGRSHAFGGERHQPRHFQLTHDDISAEPNKAGFSLLDNCWASQADSVLLALQ